MTSNVFPSQKRVVTTAILIVGMPISKDLFEHIDSLINYIPHKKLKTKVIITRNLLFETQ